MREWNELPKQMQVEEVREYYDILMEHQTSLRAKRMFDIVVSAAMLVLISPILLIIGAMIKADSQGPVFFRQVRVTTYGKKFRIYKFRTMVQNAESLGTQVTTNQDARVTKMGKLLRGCRLDELPQLINILKGEMTFVGTRPEVPKYVAAYSKEMLATLLLPAGVTSRASIEYKDEEKLLSDAEDADEVYINEVLPQKMEYNLDAIRKFSFFDDIKTMFATVAAVIK